MDVPSKTEMARYWWGRCRGDFGEAIEHFEAVDVKTQSVGYGSECDASWISQECRDYVKSCLVSSAVELGKTDLLPDDWRAELDDAGIINYLDWMRPEAWDLGRLAA